MADWRRIRAVIEEEYGTVDGYAIVMATHGVRNVVTSVHGADYSTDPKVQGELARQLRRLAREADKARKRLDQEAL